MIRPIEELMAYYAFTQADALSRKRPSLSRQARTMAKDFEAIMQGGNNLQVLSLRFGEQATLDELKQLAEIYISNFFQELSETESISLGVEDTIDLGFELQVENFVRMQERKRLLKRFKSLEMDMTMKSNELNDDQFLLNRKLDPIIFEDLKTSETKSEGSLLWRIIFLLVSLAVAAMVIRFVWFLFKS